jgi:hypothetical protein
MPSMSHAAQRGHDGRSTEESSSVSTRTRTPTSPRSAAADHRRAEHPRPAAAAASRRRPGQRRRAAHHRRRQPRPDEQRSLRRRPVGGQPDRSVLRQTRRRRLNRGGDRRANAALYRIALTRSRDDHRTRNYLERRITQGLSRRDTIRCIKRYIAREIYHLIQQINPTQVHEQLDET